MCYDLKKEVGRGSGFEPFVRLDSAACYICTKAVGILGGYDLRVSIYSDVANKVVWIRANKKGEFLLTRQSRISGLRPIFKKLGVSGVGGKFRAKEYDGGLLIMVGEVAS